MKKLVSIFLSVMVILGVFSISAFADGTEAKYYYDKFADAEEYTMKVRTFNAEAGKYSAYERKRGAITEFLHAVKNGDKDNVFRRLHEITSAVGTDSVTVAKVK